MNEDEFNSLKSKIDDEVTGDPTQRLGIAMSLRLADEFQTRELLQHIKVDLLWEFKAIKYGDRYVYPDPEIMDFNYRLGRP